MRIRQICCFLIMLSCILSAGAAQAQVAVEARTGSHDGYSRLVFEWPQPPRYSITKQENRLVIRFAQAGSLGLSGVAANDGNIRAVKALSAAGEPLQVAVEIPAGSRFRDFVVTTKMILDVYDPAGASAKERAEEKETPVAAAPTPTPAPSPALAPAPKPQPERRAADAADTAPKAPVGPGPKSDFSRSPAEDAAPAPVHSVETSAVPARSAAPHIVTLTTITSVGLAVFEREGWLWIVADTPDIASAPVIAGPQKDRIGALERIAVDGGIAWRMTLPEGLHAKAEGGGLSWRIRLEPGATAGGALAAGEGAGGEARLVWPLKNMRKVLTFTDPVIGDRITAVTASQADQHAGATRRYVELSTLPSAAGLAYLPAADDLKAEISRDAVTVGRPGGLALSSADDIRPGQIREAVNADASAPDDAPEEVPPEETPDPQEDLSLTEPPPQPEEKPGEGADDGAHGGGEANAAAALEDQVADDAVTVGASREEIEKIADEKPSGNNIYNFPRWEMGGVQALNGNLHVLMADIADKPEEARTEDFITMAKILLASRRGPEALGMLRIALLQVPELDTNAEFQSLRAAALSLSGMYDQAIEDFGGDNLAGYDDTRYWRAYTLAGLEDWRQAGEVLPADLSAVAAYPAEIRTPLLLAFAEVELRNARHARAQEILDLLRPGLDGLPLNHAAAWNYLSGEAARQAGDAAQAAGYWEPLVKNGRDDLYRAKAGLSLTKLQIDQKKLSPEEAINRLEGLRYAWRGDELETLINYRLGQMYIDNGEYLKGLSVLRNATTMTPGLQVGADVRDYMTRSFRGLFTEGRLDKVSPLEAISLYEEFKDLIPRGDQGNAYVEELAERLVDANLLGRAASLLEYMVNNRLQGDKKAEIAIRLAAIRLLDGNPDGALRSLDVAQATLDAMAGAPAPAQAAPAAIEPQAGESVPAAAQAPDPEKQRQVKLLRARALSMKKKPDEAIAILESMTLDPDVNRLRTDIAWSAGKWEEAAMSLNDLILAEDISARAPLTDYQRDLILNRAIALNLSGNRVGLANLRERYNAQMKGTPKGQVFEVVTRSRRPDMVGSREAIESMISEIDLFQGFVDGYAKMQGGGEADAGTAAPAAPTESPPPAAPPQ